MQRFRDALSIIPTRLYTTRYTGRKTRRKERKWDEDKTIKLY
jgi:hypothetical protein